MAILVFLFNDVLRTPESTKQLLCNSSTRPYISYVLRHILSTFQLGFAYTWHASAPTHAYGVSGKLGRGGRQTTKSPGLNKRGWIYSNHFKYHNQRQCGGGAGGGEFYSKDTLVQRFLISAKSSGIIYSSLYPAGGHFGFEPRARIFDDLRSSPSNADSTRVAWLLPPFFSFSFFSFSSFSYLDWYIDWLYVFIFFEYG